MSSYSIIFQELDKTDLAIIMDCFNDYGLDGFEVIEETTPEKVVDISEIRAIRELLEYKD